MVVVCDGFSGRSLADGGCFMDEFLMKKVDEVARYKLALFCSAVGVEWSWFSLKYKIIKIECERIVESNF